jgi:hypothetical protein
VAGVATHAAALPIAPLGPSAAAALVVAAALVALGHGARWRGIVIGAFSVTVAVVVGLALRGPSGVADASLGGGTRLWVVGGCSVVAVNGPVSADVLETLRTRRVHRIDVLVVTRPGSAAASSASPLIAAFRPRVVLAPEHHQVANAHTARLGAVVRVGAVAVRVTDAGPPLRVSVTPNGYLQARDPPPR